MTTYQLSSSSDPAWQRIRKPAEIAESRLITAILEGKFPINSHLPAERELAEAIGVTRPTLREALQRLERDGWIEINQGKPTRVCNYWQEGSMGVLNTLAHYPDHLPANFVEDLLHVRLAMAPSYAALAVANAPQELLQLLEKQHSLDNNALAFAQFDWQIHHALTLLSRNPVFVMILNGFKDLYLNLAPLYFSIPDARQHSMQFYEDLAQAASLGDSNQARMITEAVMRESVMYWQQVKFN